MQPRESSSRPDVNCATCRFSVFAHGNVHFCEQEDHNHAVAGDYRCQEWQPLILISGDSQPPQVFGDLHRCPSCEV